jgi:hypothetical protein
MLSSPLLFFSLRCHQPPSSRRKKTSPPAILPSGRTMSGLYSQGFSPARTLSPQIRSNPDADRYWFLNVYSIVSYCWFLIQRLLLPRPALTIDWSWFCGSFLPYYWQPVLGGASRRTPEARAVHAGAADMQPAAQPRWDLFEPFAYYCLQIG